MQAVQYRRLTGWKSRPKRFVALTKERERLCIPMCLSEKEILLFLIKYDLNTSVYNFYYPSALIWLYLNLMHKNQIQFDENTFNIVILSFREHNKLFDIQ